MSDAKRAVSDIVQLQVFRNLFSSIADEMGIALQRAAFSPNIKMRRDFSCAVFDRGGQLLAQAAHIPVHLGAMPMAMSSVLDTFDLGEGDVAILNDPYRGGTHLPDISMVSSAYAQGELIGYLMTRAHHADVGGITPASMPLSTEIYQEGVIIPPLKLVCAGQVNQALFDLILRNVRTPDERRGDFRAQLAAHDTGAIRFMEVAERYGVATVTSQSAALMDYSERMTRAMIMGLPGGRFEFEDYLDDDGNTPGRVRLHVTIRREGESNLVVDLSGCADQRAGPINAVRAVTHSALLYVVRTLLDEDVPVNAGMLRPLQLITRPGSVVDAVAPAAVSAGNVETSQRITDVLYGAFAQALPERVPAASQGTMNNLALGGHNPRLNGPFAYYETMGGGMGARPAQPGMAGVHDHMSNTLNTPIEALEIDYPLRVLRYELRRGSRGRGRHDGGDGLRRDLEFLERADATLITERRTTRPYGLHGGSEGRPGENVLIRRGRARRLPGKAKVSLEPGDVLSIRTPGGGGYGPPDVLGAGADDGTIEGRT